jgi:molybdate transport system substrate-binding protein
MRRTGILVVGALLLAGCAAVETPASPGAGDGPTGTLTVFAAASLTEAFGTLAAEFEQQNPGVDVELSFGGSSALAMQIGEGAPADVFAAANEATMQTVVDAGDAGQPTVFATNTLALVVPHGNPAGVTGLADLRDSRLAIALCDPVVPCGITAAPDTLEEDVKGVLTKVELGEADAGVVYVTDVHAAGDKVDGIEVPEAKDVINRYPIAVLSGAPNPDAARAWVDFVLSDEGRQALSDAGFVAP